MINKTDKNNLKIVILANLSTIFLNVVLCFFLPKIISISDYSLYRSFLLYTSYAGLFSFGLIHGTTLKYGYLNYYELPHNIFHFYNNILLSFTFLSYIILFTCILLISNNTESSKLVTYIFVAINIPIINFRNYYANINQFTKRFKNEGYWTFFYNILTLFMVLCMFFTNSTYIFPLIFTTCLNIITAFITLYQNKELLFGAKNKLNFHNYFPLLKEGSILMLSEYIGLLIIGTDSIFVNLFFSSTQFAVYSFSITIISGLYMVISVISTMIYPYLSRIDHSKYPIYYNKMCNILCAIIAALLASYFIIKEIVYLFLPAYADSLPILAILYITIFFRSILLLVHVNFFKAIKSIKSYILINICVLLLSIIINIIVYISFKNLLVIAAGNVILYILWFGCSEFSLLKSLHCSIIPNLKRYCLILFSCISFYLCVYNNNFFVYIFINLLITVLLFKNEILSYIKKGSTIS